MMGHILQNTKKKKTLFYFRDISKIRTFSSELDYVNYEISSLLHCDSEYTVKFVVLCYNKKWLL